MLEEERSIRRRMNSDLKEPRIDRGNWEDELERLIEQREGTAGTRRRRKNCERRKRCILIERQRNILFGGQVLFGGRTCL